MARPMGPRCKRARRSGCDLETLSGVRALDSKCKLSTPPGMHGNRRARSSDYGRSLRAKQALRWRYGITESQLRRYYNEAKRSLKGITSHNLLCLLESRLDNVVYRMGFSATRAEARQLVTHCSILVNSKVVNIPSYRVKPSDVVCVNEKSRQQVRIQAAIELAKQRSACNWIDTNGAKFEGVYKCYPARSDLPPDLNEDLALECYSK